MSEEKAPKVEVTVLYDGINETGAEHAMKVQTKKDGFSVSGFYDFGKDLNDAVEKFGEEAVFTLFQRQGKVDLQAQVRRYITAHKKELEAGKDGMDIVAQMPNAFTEFKPSADSLRRAAGPKIVSKDSILKTAEAMSPEELEALIAQLTAAKA